MNTSDHTTANDSLISHPASDVPVSSPINFSDLDMWKRAGALSIPLGIGIAAVHELAFFDAIGLPESWQFAAVIPIPLSELLRITLLSILSAAIGLTLFLALKYFLLIVWHIYRRYFHRLGSVPSGTLHESTYISAWAAQLHQNISTYTQLRPFGEHWNWPAKLGHVIAVIGVLSIIIGAIKPGVPLLLDWVFPANTLVKGVVSLVAGAFAIAVSLSLILWALGLSPRGMFSLQLSKVQALLLAAILFLSVVYGSGYESGLRVQGLLPGMADGRLSLDIDGSKCKLFHNPVLLRSYSNGYLLLSDGRLGWLPAGDGVCWTAKLYPKRFRTVNVTPTLFGEPLSFMSFPVFRSDENDKPPQHSH